jgi:benzylsuccinate CoA-transferase BbsF subunit
MAAAITGFYDLTGWADRSPAGPYLAYTDGVAPRFMLASLLSALEHRRDTGEGQHIDISQAEAAIHFLAPAILDSEINDHVWHRQGNRDLYFAPHGVYRVKGEDQWISIVCKDDRSLLSFCALAGFSDLADNTELQSREGRLKEAKMLDSLIEKWSINQEGSALESKLIAAGIAAHMVQNSPECIVDPQLKHREHFVRVPHLSTGEFVVEGTRFKLSRTPGRIEHANPEIGQHNAHVLTEILGYNTDRMADVFASLAMS